jgi:C4-dicarboxylate transporter DctM subunit
VLGIDLKTIYKGIVPFVLIYLLALVIITYVPAVSLSGVWLFLR